MQNPAAKVAIKEESTRVMHVGTYPSIRERTPEIVTKSFMKSCDMQIQNRNEKMRENVNSPESYADVVRRNTKPEKQIDGRNQEKEKDRIPNFELGY